MGIACMWLGICATRTYSPFIAGRAFLGVFEAPIESIVPSTVTDIFFLHERGEKVSVYGLSVLGGNELGPMVSAFIIQSLGMNWAFYIVGIFVFANTISIFFFMPETMFTSERPTILPGSGLRSSEKPAVHPEDEKAVTNPEGLVAVDHSKSGEAVEKKGYANSLSFWGHNDKNVSLGKAFLRPFLLLAYPTIVWSCFIYGFALSWNVILGCTIAQLFAPPYVYQIFALDEADIALSDRTTSILLPKVLFSLRHSLDLSSVPISAEPLPILLPTTTPNETTASENQRCVFQHASLHVC